MSTVQDIIPENDWDPCICLVRTVRYSDSERLGHGQLLGLGEVCRIDSSAFTLRFLLKNVSRSSMSPRRTTWKSVWKTT